MEKKSKKEEQPQQQHVTTVAVNENPKQPRVEKSSSNPPWTFLCSGVASICHSDGIQTSLEAGTGTVEAGVEAGVESSPVASQKEIALR